VGAKRLHQLSRQIVLPAFAPRVSARQDEQGGCAIDHDAAGMPDSHRIPRAIVDDEGKGHETRYLVMKPGRVVLTSAPLGEPLRLHASSSAHHGHGDKLTIAQPFARSSSEPLAGERLSLKRRHRERVAGLGEQVPLHEVASG
jgi:hypothetical protein